MCDVVFSSNSTAPPADADQSCIAQWEVVSGKVWSPPGNAGGIPTPPDDDVFDPSGAKSGWAATLYGTICFIILWIAVSSIRRRFNLQIRTEMHLGTTKTETFTLFAKEAHSGLAVVYTPGPAWISGRKRAFVLASVAATCLLFSVLVCGLNPSASAQLGGDSEGADSSSEGLLGVAAFAVVVGAFLAFACGVSHGALLLFLARNLSVPNISVWLVAPPCFVCLGGLGGLVVLLATKPYVGVASLWLAVVSFVVEQIVVETVVLGVRHVFERELVYSTYLQSPIWSAAFHNPKEVDIQTHVEEDNQSVAATVLDTGAASEVELDFYQHVPHTEVTGSMYTGTSHYPRPSISGAALASDSDSSRMFSARPGVDLGAVSMSTAPSTLLDPKHPDVVEILIQNQEEEIERTLIRPQWEAHQQAEAEVEERVILPPGGGRNRLQVVDRPDPVSFSSGLHTDILSSTDPDPIQLAPVRMESMGSSEPMSSPESSSDS